MGKLTLRKGSDSEIFLLHAQDMMVDSGKIHKLLCLSIGFSFAVLLSLGGSGQKVARQASAITMALQSVEPARTQLSHSARPLPPLNPRKIEMALKKSGMSMKEYEANKRRCQQDAVRYAGKVMGSTGLIGAMTAGCEALALVDDRLAGEGTGKILGINDPALLGVILGVFTTIWALYYFGSQNLTDEGIGLD